MKGKAVVESLEKAINLEIPPIVFPGLTNPVVDRAQKADPVYKANESIYSVKEMRDNGTLETGQFYQILANHGKAAVTGYFKEKVIGTRDFMGVMGYMKQQNNNPATYTLQ